MSNDKALFSPINNNIIVKFDYDKSSSTIKLDSGLIVPERYVIEEADGDAQTAWGVTTDRRLINPQIIDVLSGKYTGVRAFVHYGAFEVCKWLDEEHAVIPSKMMLFCVEPIQCLPGIYLGEEVFGELPKTVSGIYLTPQMEDKVGIKIKITHAPEKAHPLIQVGSTVITIDAFQYDLTYQGKKYIKLEESEIIGVEQNGEYIPLGNSVLVEYLPDVDLEARIVENDRRRAQRDYIDKNRMHISDKYTRGLDPDYLDVPEPKTIFAKIMAIGDLITDKSLQMGDKLLVLRNYGCILPNKQWILNMDLVLGVFE